MSVSINPHLAFIDGTPSQANVTTVSFTGTAASGVLATETQYRLFPQNDCFISFIQLGIDGQVTVAGHPLLAGVEYFYTTDNKKNGISVLRSDGTISSAPAANGTLWVTKMPARRDYLKP